MTGLVRWSRWSQPGARWKNGEEGFEVSTLGLEGILCRGAGLQPQVEAEPRRQAVAAIRAFHIASATERCWPS
jgi:hypothetical protein